MTSTCADLDCSEAPVHRLRYQAPSGEHVYDLCAHHLDRAHHWLAARPELALTAISERLQERLDQPALF